MKLTPKLVFLLMGVLVMVSIVGIAMGYGGTSPSDVGHTPGEMAPGTFAGGGNYVFPADNTKVVFGNNKISMYYNTTLSALVIEG